jgi:hypothetical protein
MMTTRRAAVDEGFKEKMRQRVRELLDERDGGPSDGEVYLFDEPLSREARLAMRLATDFPTQDALDTYLEAHPDADRSNHKVVKTQRGPAKKDEPGPEDKGKGEEDKSGDKGRKEEQPPERKKPEQKLPEQKGKDDKGKSKREIFLGPDSPHHPSKAPEGEARGMAIKDALVSEFGEDAVEWRTHKVHETQLTPSVTVRFPDGTRKKYKDLSDDEQARVKQAISEGMAATKGMNDYTRADVSTMRRNMDNNLSVHDDKDVEETKNESTDEVKPEGASELAKVTRDNGRALVRKYRSAMSSVSEPMAEKCVDDYSEVLKEAVSDGSLSGVSQGDLDEFVREDVKRLVHQEVETQRRSLGDHGIRHVAGNVRSTLGMLGELASHGVSLTGKQKLMAVAIQMNHDQGYTVGEAATDISKGKAHKKQSEQLAEQEKSRYEKVFGKEDAEKIVRVIGTHDSNEIDWDEDPVGSAVRLADNTSLFGNDKVQDLFVRNPKTMALACKLRLAAQAKPDDKELQKNIKGQMHDAVDGAGFDESDAEELHRQVDEMSEGKFSTTADILSRYSGKLKGFRYEPEKKMMAVDMAYSPEGETVDALFGDQLAAQQFDKFAKDGNVQPMRGKRGKMTFKNAEGKRVFSVNIDGFDEEPISSASTGAMRSFLGRTARGELRHAAGILKRKDAGEKEVGKAKKAMDEARQKLTEKEWEELMKAFEEGKDVAALAKKLDAWPLFEAEIEYLGSKEASLRRIAAEVWLAELAWRVGVSGMQVVRKDKDTMSDTGGSSKTRRRDPDVKPPRDDVRKPFRERNRTEDEKDDDAHGRKDRDVTASFDFVTMAKSELAKWPRRLADAVRRML